MFCSKLSVFRASGIPFTTDLNVGFRVQGFGFWGGRGVEGVGLGIAGQRDGGADLRRGFQPQGCQCLGCADGALVAASVQDRRVQSNCLCFFGKHYRRIC